MVAELAPLEQAVALLQPSRTPVLIIPKQPSTDALAAGIALLLTLEKMGKNVRLVCPEFSLPPGHGFLPKSDAIEQELASLRTFVITVDVAKTKLESLSYDIRDNQLFIYLSPRNGFYEPKDVSMAPGPFAYDAIVTLDAPSLERLGRLYSENSEFFYQTPIVNIDHRAENTRFGHANLVEVAATSVSEIVFDLIRALGVELLDEQIATSLLAGIISKTKVFQSHTVTPRSLSVASHLMSAGARRDEIIRHLYQTKTIPALKLWGRALAKIQSAAGGRVVWSSLTKRELEDSAAAPADALGALDELMINTPDAQFVCLFVEAADGTDVHLSHLPTVTPPSLPPALRRQAPQYLTGRLAEPLLSAEKRIIALLTAGTSV